MVVDVFLYLCGSILFFCLYFYRFWQSLSFYKVKTQVFAPQKTQFFEKKEKHM